jgi:type IV secretory pathway VirB2 component (pilin)
MQLVQKVRFAPLALAAFAVSAMPAHAQSITGGGTGSATTFINNIANLATGTLGQALSILALAIAGISFAFGAASFRTLGGVIMGVVIIFSAAWMVGQITGGSAGAGL